MPHSPAQLRSAAVRHAKPSPNELNDENVQAEIESPKPLTIAFGGEQLALYPLSGASARELMGFANEILAAIGVREGAFAPRLVSVLTTKRFVGRLLRFVAESTAQKPGSLPEEQIETIVSDLDKRTASPRGAMDIAVAFDALWALNELEKAFSPNA